MEILNSFTHMLASNTASVLAVIILASLTIYTFYHRDKFFAQDSPENFFFYYVFAFSLLVGLFTYQSAQIYLQGETPQHAVGLAGVITISIIGFYYFGENGNDERLLEFLWDRFSKRRGRIFLGMLILLSLPFVGIFFYQSGCGWGIGWFLGIIILACIVQLGTELKDFRGGFETEG